jgi:hypothetical protein
VIVTSTGRQTPWIDIFDWQAIGAREGREQKQRQHQFRHAVPPEIMKHTSADAIWACLAPEIDARNARIAEESTRVALS